MDIRVLNGSGSRLRHFQSFDLGRLELKVEMKFDEHATVIQQRTTKKARVLQIGLTLDNNELAGAAEWTSRLEIMDIMGPIYSTQTLYTLIRSNFRNLRSLAICITMGNPPLNNGFQAQHENNVAATFQENSITYFKVYMDVPMYQGSQDEKKEVLITLSVALLQMAKKFRNLNTLRVTLPSDPQHLIYGAVSNLIQGCNALKNKGEIRTEPGVCMITYNYPPPEVPPPPVLGMSSPDERLHMHNNDQEPTNEPPSCSDSSESLPPQYNDVMRVPLLQEDSDDSRHRVSGKRSRWSHPQ